MRTDPRPSRPTRATRPTRPAASAPSGRSRQRARLAGLGTGLVVGALLAVPARADRLVTLDGRVLDVVSARPTEGGYRLLFRHGEIVCPADRVAEVEVEGDMAGYEPANERERELLAQGYVRHRGRWVSKARYLELAAEESEARRRRIEELESHADIEHGWRAESEHFRFCTNTSPALLARYTELFDAFYHAMEQHLDLETEPAEDGKLLVDVHRSQEEFRERFGVDASTFGFFSPSERSLDFFHEYDEPTRSTWIALHECTHFLTFLLQPELEVPVWINEALADYYGSVKSVRDPNGRLRLEPGQVLAGRVLTVQQALRRGDALGLEQLVALGPQAFGPFEYAHAWSLVYFLNQGPRRRGFEDFLDRLFALRGIAHERVPADTATGFAERVRSEDVLALLLDRLHVEAPELEREWHAFVAAVEVDGPEARLERGYELVRAGAPLGQPELRNQALADLIAAVEGGVRDPRVWIGLGWIRIHEGKRAEAAGEFRRAVAMEPLNARYRFDLAYALTGLREPGGYAEGSVRDLTEARRELGLCTELDPENERYRAVYATLVTQLEDEELGE